MTQKEFLKRLKAAQDAVAKEIARNRGDGSSLFARGFSGEGFAGGYAAALNDVQAILIHGYPSDSRGYWRAKP